MNYKSGNYTFQLRCGHPCKGDGIVVDPFTADAGNPEFVKALSKAIEIYPEFQDAAWLDITISGGQVDPHQMEIYEIEQQILEVERVINQKKFPVSSEDKDMFEKYKNSLSMEISRRGLAREQKEKRDAEKARRDSLPKDGYIYLLESDQNIYKIGYTKNPDRRAATFGLQLPFSVRVKHLIPTNHMRIAEKQLHDKYSKYRVNGEWFRLNDSHVEEIMELKFIKVDF